MHSLSILPLSSDKAVVEFPHPNTTISSPRDRGHSLLASFLEGNTANIFLGKLSYALEGNLPSHHDSNARGVVRGSASYEGASKGMKSISVKRWNAGEGAAR